MGRTTAYYRDPETRQWVPRKGNTSEKSQDKPKNKGSSPSASGAKAGNDGSPSSTDSKSPEGKSKQKQKKIEYYTLSGDISIVPGKQSIKIKAGDTVSVKGIGKYLSGKYYVQDVTRTIDGSSGYSQSMTLLDPSFRRTLKKLKHKKKKGKKK